MVFVDPKSAAEGAAAAEKGIQETLKMINHIKENVKRSELIIKNEEIRINCAEETHLYSIAIEKKKGLIGNKDLIFKNVTPRSIELRSLSSAQNKNDAIARMNTGFAVKTGLLDEGELYLLEIENEIPDPKFISLLVDKVEPRDVPHTEDDNGVLSYELNAQLKHLKKLKQDYGAIKLRDLDFSVDVSVQEDVNDIVPSEVKQEIEALINVATKARGRDEDFQNVFGLRQAAMDLHRIKTGSKYGGTVFDILKNLSDAFLPKNFMKYVDVIGGFQYYNCRQGIPVYKIIPTQSWPQFMSITSKTSLSLETPAADGKLLYKKSDFINRLSSLF